MQTVLRLETNHFIDEATRALFVEVLLHSTNTNLVTHVRMLLEFDSSGIIIPTSRITVAETDLYETSVQQLRAFFESAFFTRCSTVSPSPVAAH